MEFPLEQVLSFDGNKNMISVAMMKYAQKIEEDPEILLEYTEKDRDKRVAIIIKDILTGKVKYKYKGE